VFLRPILGYEEHVGDSLTESQGFFHDLPDMTEKLPSNCDQQ
jgi:hypothetical protein